jgi:hypothetical protein
MKHSFSPQTKTMNSNSNSNSTTTEDSCSIGSSTYITTRNHPNLTMMTPEKEAAVSSESPSLPKSDNITSTPRPVFSPCAAPDDNVTAHCEAAPAPSLLVKQEEEESSEDSLSNNNNEDNEPSAPVQPPALHSYPPATAASTHSPPVTVNPSYSYYGPSFTAARNFNQTNHAMMQTIKTFPEKLHQILEVAAQNGMADVISFFPHGRSFKVHKVCLHPSFHPVSGACLILILASHHVTPLHLLNVPWNSQIVLSQKSCHASSSKPN